MKSSKRLDSVCFQLTPTRTRFDLVITAKGKTEKIGSGLLNPFLAHLKTAQDQINKGGYSILLEPSPDSDTSWFTKGTVERFVRFVSTPEIIERVYSLESEILQLEKAIAIQGNNDMGLATVEENKPKLVGSKEGIKSTTDSSNETAIVLYNPEAHRPEANGSKPEHGNSKVQLLKVLETRKTVLQKEQGMAFARAVAAGFDIDHMAPLLSFAECFGASRLLEACSRFIQLWKQKHETGQWVEVEEAQALSIPPTDFSLMTNQQIELHGDFPLETNGKPDPNASIDENRATNPQAQVGQQGYYQGQFPYPIYPTWPANSPPGAMPVYQPYPMPYYQPYPGNGPFYPPPHQESGHNNSHRRRERKHSDDSRDANSESEESVSENDGSRKKAGKKNKKKKPGMVVIRNINYVTSKDRNYSSSESEVESDAEIDEERKGRNINSTGEFDSYNVDPISGKESGHWEAFQSFLLRDPDEKNRGDDQHMFGLEKNNKTKRLNNIDGDDPLALVGRDSLEAQNGRISELDNISGNATRLMRSSNDERLMSREGYQVDNQMDVRFTELNGRKLAYRNNGNDDFMAIGREGQSYASLSADPQLLNISNLRDNENGTTDESFIVPLRSNQVRTSERTANYMDSELSSAKPEDDYNKNGHKVNYEPDYLSLMPERGTEKGLMGFDPASEYEMKAHIGDSASLENQNKEVLADKTKKTPNSSDKKKATGPIRKGKPSKSSPLDDAKARAEKLRSYKADLQKLKKEKEEEQQKRLDALKRERQKRIAARGGAAAAQSPPSQEIKKKLPATNSRNSLRGSKFSDTDPGSSSPLQRSKLRTVSLGTPESQKASTTTKSNNEIHLSGNRLTRSVSSLPEQKKEKNKITPDSKASMARIRRLSEPKASSNSSVSSVKTRTPPSVNKPKVQGLPESKKIAAIINLDKSKAATLPELKIKTTKGPIETGHGKFASKESLREMNKYQNDEDNNPIIDKTVVISESEKPSSTVTGVQKEKYNIHEKSKNVEGKTGYAIVGAPASLPDGINEPIHSQLLEQPRSYKVNTAYTDKEPPKMSGTQITEMPWQPPLARLSSMEDPISQMPRSKSTLITSETSKRISQNDKTLKIDTISEALEKTHVKDSPKGFKRLLLFGKKSHNSAAAGEQSLESDKTIVNGSELNDNGSNAASSSEAHSLKNLISQETSPAVETTTHKSSRHFSLLSPFRSKTSEKKSTT